MLAGLDSECQISGVGLALGVRGRTAVEGKGLGILLGNLVRGVRGWVLDAASLAVRGGQNDVVEVDEVGGRCCCEHVARWRWQVSIVASHWRSYGHEEDFTYPYSLGTVMAIL